jgi:hypothetical protein
MNQYILKNDSLDKLLTKHDNLNNAMDLLNHMKKALPVYKYSVYKIETIINLKKLGV